MAASPTTTMTARSTVGRQPAPDPGAEQAAEDRAGGDQPGRRPVDVRGDDEDDRGDEVGQPGEHVLQRVLPLQRLGQEQRRGSPSAARPAPRRSSRRRRRCRARPPTARRSTRSRAPWPRGRRASRSAACRTTTSSSATHDQHRDDGLERAGRQLSSSTAPTTRAEHDAAPSTSAPAALPGQLAPVAVRADERAREQPDGVGDVGRHRRQPDAEQHREGDQRARADDGVDRAGPEPATRDEQPLPQSVASPDQSVSASPPLRCMATRRRVDGRRDVQRRRLSRHGPADSSEQG